VCSSDLEMQRACGSDMECMWVTQAFLRNGMGASLDVAVGPNPSVAIMDMLEIVKRMRAAAKEKQARFRDDCFFIRSLRTSYSFRINGWCTGSYLS
jgi:hypothetical protein